MADQLYTGEEIRARGYNPDTVSSNGGKYYLSQFEGGSGGGSRTATAPDISSIPTVSSFIDKLNVGEDAAMGKVIEAMNARQKPLDIYTGLEAEAGIPQLRTTAGNISKEINRIEDTIDALDSNISARTRESMVTEAMRQRMIAAEADPLQKSLSKLTTGLGRVQGAISEGMQGINTKTSLAVAGQNMDLEPFQLQYSTLVDRNTRALTGFTADRETAIDQIYKKWERGNQISDQEWQLASEAAISENNYNREVAKAAASAGVSDLSGSTNDLLARIGKTVSDQQAFENKLKNYTTYKGGSGSSGVTVPTSSSGRYTVTPTKITTQTQDLLSLFSQYNK